MVCCPARPCRTLSGTKSANLSQRINRRFVISSGSIKLTHLHSCYRQQYGFQLMGLEHWTCWGGIGASLVNINDLILVCSGSYYWAGSSFLLCLWAWAVPWHLRCLLYHCVESLIVQHKLHKTGEKNVFREDQQDVKRVCFKYLERNANRW